jgi:conjugal transfer ATP-binding protein TraC
MGSGIGRLILDPFSMLLYSTTAEDFEVIKGCTDRGMDVADAIDEVLNQRGIQ